MSYSKFKNIKVVAQTFGYAVKSKASLFKDISLVQPSQRLLDDLEEAEKMKYFSEAERSERIVAPVLKELNRNNNFELTIYAGRELTIDAKRGLCGECDYLLSYGTIMDIVDIPLFSLVEAKRQDVEHGTAQCAAQLIGAKIYNQNDGLYTPLLYGCSSTGDIWRFLMIDYQEIILDDRHYSIKGQLAEILGILQFIVNNTAQYRTLREM